MTEIATWYDEFYRGRRHVPTGPWYAGVAAHLREFAPDIKALSVLEVGCGSGAFLSSLSADLMVGIELSHEAASQSHQRGVAVAVAAAENLPFQSGRFDVVVCCEVLEHVRTVEEALDEIDRTMCPGGLLICSTPNYLNLPWLALRLLADLLKKKNWTVRQPIDRLFTSIGLRLRLKGAGFDVMAVEGWVMEPPGWWHFRSRHGLRPHHARGVLGHLALHPVFAAIKRHRAA